MSRDWVLIRGIVSEEFHWWHLPDYVRQRFPQDQIYAADITGNGRSHRHSTPLEISKNIEGLRHQVPSSGKKILIGFSLGAMLALEWAYAHPEEVEGVVMINTSLNNSPIYHRMMPQALWQIAKAALQRDLLKREEMLLSLTTGLEKQRIHEIAPIWAERSKIFPQSGKNFLRQLQLARKISQRAEPPPVPVLILNSAKDRVVSPRCSQKIAATWNLPLIVHPTAGHDLSLEDPHWVLDRVTERYGLQISDAGWQGDSPSIIF